MTDALEDQSVEQAASVPSNLRVVVVGLAVLAMLAGAAAYMALSAAEQFLPTERVSGVVSDQGVSRDKDGDETYWTRFRLISGDEIRTSGRALYNGTGRGTEVQIELGRLTSRVVAVHWPGDGTDARDGNGTPAILVLTGVFGVGLLVILGGVLKIAEAGTSRRVQLFAMVTGVMVMTMWQLLVTPDLGPR